MSYATGPTGAWGPSGLSGPVWGPSGASGASGATGMAGPEHNHEVNYYRDVWIGGTCVTCLINRIASLETIVVKGTLWDLNVFPKELEAIIVSYIPNKS